MTGLFAFNAIALILFFIGLANTSFGTTFLKVGLFILILMNLTCLANELDIVTLNLKVPIEASEI